MDLEKFLMFEKGVMLEEISRLANFHSTTLQVEYGDGTLANEKYIHLDDLEKILTMISEDSVDYNIYK